MFLNSAPTLHASGYQSDPSALRRVRSWRPATHQRSKRHARARPPATSAKAVPRESASGANRAAPVEASDDCRETHFGPCGVECSSSSSGSGLSAWTQSKYHYEVPFQSIRLWFIMRYEDGGWTLTFVLRGHRLKPPLDSSIGVWPCAASSNTRHKLAKILADLRQD